MEREYQVDLKRADEQRREEEIDAFVKTLLELAKESGLINFDEYEKDYVRHELFSHVAKIVRESLIERECSVKDSIGQGGFVGTISITGKQIEPRNDTLFKSAILASDSLEMEADLEGNVVVNLTFFDMLKKVSDWSKN